ncbi:hypothetical protein CHKEEEPN_1386 [Methylorubrum podarium]|nr:hypothetical protein CHKEEEPN_1386 [Methylorubrum podarium]
MSIKNTDETMACDRILKRFVKRLPDAAHTSPAGPEREGD